ncbi:hypothetical protein GCM10010388_68380 [Streptomyces mauvecolor]
MGWRAANGGARRAYTEAPARAGDLRFPRLPGGRLPGLFTALCRSGRHGAAESSSVTDPRYEASAGLRAGGGFARPLPGTVMYRLPQRNAASLVQRGVLWRP